MKKSITSFAVILFAVFMFTSCVKNQNNSKGSLVGKTFKTQAEWPSSYTFISESEVLYCSPWRDGIVQKVDCHIKNYTLNNETIEISQRTGGDGGKDVYRLYGDNLIVWHDKEKDSDFAVLWILQ